METTEKTVETIFYPNVRKHCSPSSIDSWLSTKSGFSRSYFELEGFKGNASTRAGKVIHALIEAGLLAVKHQYANRELKLVVMLPNGVEVLGYPDSHELNVMENVAYFVDYKTGKTNTWTNYNLAVDDKMRATAWLVWKTTGMPAAVHGSIEYIPTQWNSSLKEIEPTGEPSEVVATVIYTAAELERFTGTILKVIEEVNAAYLLFLQSTEAFISEEDIAEVAKIDKEIAALETRQAEIKERVKAQMEFGYKTSIKTEYGSFYFTTKTTYDYPKDMEFVAEGKVYNFEMLEKIAGAAKVAKTEWEQFNEPSNVSTTLAYKPKTERKK